jgi:hypothetical protein
MCDDFGGVSGAVVGNCDRVGERVADRGRCLSSVLLCVSRGSPGSPPVFATAVHPAGQYQLVKASCGHLLWFSAKTAVPLGGWVGCPQHGPTGVRDITLTVGIPRDVLPGTTLPVCRTPTLRGHIGLTDLR